MAKKKLTKVLKEDVVEEIVEDEVVEEKAGEPEVYVYRSVAQETIILKPTQRIEKTDHNGNPMVTMVRAAKAKFDGRIFVLNQKQADQMNLSIADVVYLMERSPGFGKTHRLIYAPGVRPDAETLAFAEKCRQSNRHTVKVIKGVRPTIDTLIKK